MRRAVFNNNWLLGYCTLKVEQHCHLLSRASDGVHSMRRGKEEKEREKSHVLWKQMAIVDKKKKCL